MADNEEVGSIEDILFNGGLTQDVDTITTEEEPEVIVDGFGVHRVEDNESNEPIIQEPQPQQQEINPLQSQIEALQNQVQQLQTPAPPQMSAADKRAMDTGNALLQIQQNKPLVYDKLTNFLNSELSGNPTDKNEFNQEAEAIHEMLSNDYKDIDTKPLKKILKAMQTSNSSSKSELKQIMNVVNQMQQRMNGLEQYKSNVENNNQQTKMDNILAELVKAETDFGFQISQGSEEAQDIAALIKSGRSPRAAFKKIYGKTDKDIVTEKPKRERQISQTPKGNNGQSQSPQVDKLQKQMFGQKLTSADLFKK